MIYYEVYPGFRVRKNSSLIFYEVYPEFRVQKNSGIGPQKATKNKTCKNIANVLEKYLKNSEYKYSHIFSDEGQEYLGGEAQKIYDKFV